MVDFAANGLDSGASLNGGYPSTFSGSGNAAFAGANPAVGVGTFSYPIGKSAYDGLQINLREQKANPMRGIVQTNLEVSYAYSRFISTTGLGSTASSSDSFFSPPTYNNRNATQYMGYGDLDRTHILSFGGAFQPKWGPRIGVIAHFNSANPTNLTLDQQGATGGEIFRTDVNGDGQTGALVPGTDPGAYMRKVKPGQLNGFINNYNSQYANSLTPAGQVLVSNGLFTSQEMIASGAVMPTLANAPTNPFHNSIVKTMDANFSYPIHISRLGESFSIEPSVAIYNVANFANYSSLTNPGVILSTATCGGECPAGSVNGSSDFNAYNGNRISRRSGVFDQGAPRATEFQLKLNF